MFFSCECCALLDRALRVGLITRPEESYLMRSVQLSFFREGSIMRKPWPTRSACPITAVKEIVGNFKFHFHVSPNIFKSNYCALYKMK